MSQNTIVSYKGFDADWTCRGYAYQIGQTYEHEGAAVACESGFHACEYPLDVFAYYPPAGSRFAIAEQSGELSRHDGDTKVASSRIHVKAEIGIAGLIAATFEYLKTRTEPANAEHATGDRSASSATGYRSASSATGDSSASSATGDSSASSATGDRSASLTTGWYSTSEITPDAKGKPLHAVAIAAGGESKARAPEGCAIVLVERNTDGELLHIFASKVGENGIKPNVFYVLQDGKPVEAE